MQDCPWSVDPSELDDIVITQDCRRPNRHVAQSQCCASLAGRGGSSRLFRRVDPIARQQYGQSSSNLSERVLIVKTVRATSGRSFQIDVTGQATRQVICADYNNNSKPMFALVAAVWPLNLTAYRIKMRTRVGIQVLAPSLVVRKKIVLPGR
jgi:hypothetical protein